MVTQTKEKGKVKVDPISVSSFLIKQLFLQFSSEFDVLKTEYTKMRKSPYFC